MSTISREELISLIDGYARIRSDVQLLPPAEPERKKGKWLEMRYCDYYVHDLQMCRCSECGRYDIRPYLYYFQKPNFCSWCGAEMKGEEE